MKKITIKKGDRFKSDGVEEIEKLLKTTVETQISGPKMKWKKYIKAQTSRHTHIHGNIW